MSAGTHGSDPVLIVDDDDGIALLERRILARAGWQSRFAADIGEALAALTEQRFAAVLLDYHLPEGMGWPVLDAARHLVPRVPVIIVTAAGDERVAAEAVRRGAADYLIKTDAFLDQIPTVLERVLRLHEAEETRSRLAAIVDASSDAIISATIDGIISSWNPGAEALYGYTAPEALGRPLSILMPPERAAIAAAIFEQLRRGERIGPTEAVHLRKDGSRVDVSLIISPHRDSAGRVVAASAIARDMAERRAAEAMLHRAKDEAEAAVRTRAEFLANVSHEIRTPMNGVVGMTSLLLDTPLSAEQREYVEAIRSSGNALLTIVNEILDYSKIEAGGLEIDRRPFVLRRCVEEAIDLVATQAAAKGLELCVDIDEGVPDALLGDVTRLRQVLVNLLANAVKFTERGEVVVGIDPARSGAPAGTWRFLVRDTGIGIPRDRLDRLFRPFSQVDAGIARKYGGTGLGLAITRYLVEKMGGALGVLSEEGRGSTFAFTLPAEACEMEGAPESQSPSALMGRRVLIVDDNATCRRLLRSQAMSWGMLPAVFGSAGEALAFLASQPGAPPVDVAVLDSSMPGTDGFALAASIRRRHSALPIVMLVVFGEAGSRREVERSEHAAFVSKPVKPSALRDALLSALSGNVTAASAGPASAFDGELGKRHPLRILIAEDHSVNQRLAIQMLKRLGYRADVVANGLEVLDALERQPYDVILMDVQMPELDGIGATREIRRRSGAGSAPWIIAMTANAMREDRQRCLEAGMDDYIAKPLSAAALTAAIERAAGVPRRKQPTPRPGAKRTPSAPMPAVSIHRGPFDALVALVGGDQAALAALLDEHLAASSALIASMREALSRGDMGALRDAARSLKGVASKFGALALSHRCARLMRVLDPAGQFAAMPDDASVLLPREIDDAGPFYSLYPEGYVEHFDGSTIPTFDFLSDNGVDMNRNFPFSWAPEPHQEGAGPFAASEPESRAVATFALTHPNIFAWLNLHTYGGCYIRPSGHLSDKKMDPSDLWVFEQIARFVEPITGYPVVSGFEEFTYEPDTPLRGDLSTFAYEQCGAVAMVCELWDLRKQTGMEVVRPFVNNYAKRPRADMRRMLEWDRKENGGRVSQPWRPFDHPQLGRVEVGGYDPLIGFWNPPPERLAEVCDNQSRALLRWAALSPRLRVTGARVEALEGGLSKVSATVENVGFLPTNVLHSALKFPWNDPVRARIALGPGAELVGGDAVITVGHLDGWTPSAVFSAPSFARTTGGRTRARVEWIVRGSGEIALSAGCARTGQVTAHVASKGGA